jgi:hypothetical protein
MKPPLDPDCADLAPSDPVAALGARGTSFQPMRDGCAVDEMEN